MEEHDVFVLRESTVRSSPLDSPGVSPQPRHHGLGHRRRARHRRAHDSERARRPESPASFQNEDAPPASACSGTGPQAKDQHVLQRKRHRNLEQSLFREVDRLIVRNKELEDHLTAAELACRGVEGELTQAQRRCIELERLAQHGEVGGNIACAMSENEDLRKQLSAYAVEIDVLREEKASLVTNLQAAQETVKLLSDEREKNLSSSGRALLEIQESCSGFQQQATQYAAMLSDKEHKLQQLTDVIEPMREKLVELQEAYVHQTQHFATFVREVRKRQRDITVCFEEARGELVGQHRSTATFKLHLADVNASHDHSYQCALQHQEEQKEKLQELQAIQTSHYHRKTPRVGRTPKSIELFMLERALERNIADEMVKSLNGIALQKVQERTHAREPRMVVLSDREMLLRWWKPQGARLPAPRRSDSSLDLYEVIRIDYGSMARACVIYNDVHPWHCFSLYTIRRSYDFICPDDEAVRCFVLSISRLCPWVAGAVRTRHAFECEKGWCKVNEYCFKERKTVARAMLEAARVPVGYIRPAGAQAEAKRRGSPVEAFSSRTRVSDRW